MYAFENICKQKDKKKAKQKPREKCTVKDALFDRLMGLLDAAIASNATGDVELVDIEPKYV